MRQKWVLFERFALSLPYPLPMLHIRQYQGNSPLLPAARLNEIFEILRFEENHGPDPR